MKNSNDTNVNQTRDLPTCSAVPPPTAPLHTPLARSIDTILMRLAERVARMGEARSAQKFLVWKSERNRLLGRSRLKW